jgi:glucose-6-phosphate 1-dehydrogenase
VESHFLIFSMVESERHPFLQGLSQHRGAPATLMVIFGASGDLTSRKLIPALYNLGQDNLLPERFHLIGVGRTEQSDEGFRQTAIEDLKKFSRRAFSSSLWNTLNDHIHYHAGSYDDLSSYVSLKEKIEAIDKTEPGPIQLLFYISTPPTVFKPILQNLGLSGLAAYGPGGKFETKVIIEKPFGRDLETARELNRVITSNFHERQVYRIDHYLGKETVQNLLVQRFANAIFEPIWNRSYVSHVSITVAENLGVGSRGGYYEKSGALRDMIQNHTMQLLALVAMEPPMSLNPESIRDEKVKVMHAIQPLALNHHKPDAVRAQYLAGLVGGKVVLGYKEEQGISPDSITETYAALRLAINNWRWQGVPFYLRSGKRLARRVSEIAVHFKRPPGVLFGGDTKFDLSPNVLVFQVQPDEGLTLLLNSKIPGLETRTQPVKMHFSYSTTFGSNTPEAYERLILDAMLGDSTLFIRGDETEASWKLITPVLDFWSASKSQGMDGYIAGSWGPFAADQLLVKDGNEWRRC